MSTPEQQPTPETTLNPDDQDWLDDFGVDPSWQDDPEKAEYLNELVHLGSLRLTELSHEESEIQTTIVDSRKEFLRFLNIPKEIRDNFKVLPRPNILIQTHRIIHETGLNGRKILIANREVFGPETVQDRLDNFAHLGLDPKKILSSQPRLLKISTYMIQRNMTRLSMMGFNAVKIANSQPHTLFHSPMTIKRKLEDLTQLGLVDPIKKVNISPFLLNYRPSFLQMRMDHFSKLGVNAAKLLNNQPSILIYPLESIQQKIDFLKSIGLNTTKIINSQPQLLGCSIETIKKRLNCFEQLGLNSIKVAEGQPMLLASSIDTVQKKASFIAKNAKLLKWEHTTKELMEMYPGILTCSLGKLAVLCRIAAKNLDESGRNALPSQIMTAIIKPLEKHIIYLHQHDPDGIYTLKELTTDEPDLNSSERKALALEIAPEMGAIGARYLEYRK